MRYLVIDLVSCAFAHDFETCSPESADPGDVPTLFCLLDPQGWTPGGPQRPPPQPQTCTSTGLLGFGQLLALGAWESPQGCMLPPVCGIIQLPHVCHSVKKHHLVIFTDISLITNDVRRPSVHSPLLKIFH